MNTTAVDTETCPFRPALLAPGLVCVTWQSVGEDAGIDHHLSASCEARLEGWLRSDRIVGAHIAFDMAVVAERYPRLRPLIFQAYEEDRVTDVLIRQKLIDIASGVYRGRFVGKNVWIPFEYSLEKVAKRNTGVQLQKDAWRMSYGEFLHTPLTDWLTRAVEVQAEARGKLSTAEQQLANLPKSEKKAEKALTKEIEGLRDMIASSPRQCLEYPLEDARATLASWQAQEKHAFYLEDQYRQARAAFALYLSSVWGLRTDANGVEILRRETTLRLEDLEEQLQAPEVGLVRENGVRDTKAAKLRMIRICAREGLPLRRTEAHDRKNDDEAKCKAADGTPLKAGDERCAEHVCLDRDACEATGDHILEAYAELSTSKKILSNDVKALEKGEIWPFHTRYDIAETGRGISSKPNIMNWARGRKCRACAGKGEVAYA